MGQQLQRRDRKRGREECATRACGALSVWFCPQFRLSSNGTNGASSSSHGTRTCGQFKEVEMLYYAVVFFIIALIAALFGFGGIAAGAASIAKILFVVFLIVALVTFLLSLVRR